MKKSVSWRCSVFPIADDNIRGAPPPIITWALVVLNVLVFLYQLTLSQAALRNFFSTFGAVPVLILQGEQLYSLITSMFLHGGWLHIIGNMVFLYVFGDNVETVMGKLGYLVFYLVGGLAASAAFIVLHPDTMIPSLGASGALAAVLGAYIVMFPRSQVRALVFLGFFVTVTRITAFVFLGLWFVLQLFQGFGALGAEQTGGVAYWAHIGGFLFGLVVGFVLRNRAREIKRFGV
jgi:membrane associated rhomboid family serine protease